MGFEAGIEDVHFWFIGILPADLRNARPVTAGVNVPDSAGLRMPKFLGMTLATTGLIGHQNTMQ